MGMLGMIARSSRNVLSIAVMSASVIVFAVPGQSWASGISELGGDYRGASPAFSFSEDENSCDQVRQVESEISPWDYEPSDVLRTASGVVKVGSTPVSGALVFSFAIASTQDGFQISKMSCVETGLDGTFTIDVLRNIAGTGITISPAYTADFGTQLGSRTIGVATGVGPLALGNVLLSPANNRMLLYSQLERDNVTGPTNVACFAFDIDNNPNTPNNKLASCTMARGRTIAPFDIVAMRTTTTQYGDQPAKVVRFYFSNTPEVAPTSFEVSVMPEDLAAFNGRWAASSNGFQEEDPDGDGTLGNLKFLEASIGAADPTIALETFSGESTPKVSATLWAAWTTIPSASLDGTIPNLNDGVSRNASINFFSRNIRSNDVPEIATRSEYWDQATFCTDYSNDSVFPAPTCTPFKSLTTLYSESKPWGWGEQWFSTTPWNSGGENGGCGSVGDGNFQGIIKDDQGNPFTGCGNVDAARFDSTIWGGSPGWDHQGTGISGSVDPSGRFGLQLSNGIYQLTFRPNSSTTFAESALVVKISGGTIERCASFSLEQSLTESSRCTSTWTALTATDGVYPFQIKPANFYGQVSLPPNGTPVSNSARVRVELRPLVSSNGGFYFGGGGIGTETGEGGKFLIRVEDGSYQIQIPSPEGQNFAQISKYIQVSSSGSVIKQCATFDAVGGSLSDCAPLTGMAWDNPFGLQYRDADFTGRVSGSAYFWVEVQKRNTSRCEDCYDYLSNLSTSANSSGSFSMNFDQAGDYRLVLNPPQGGSSGATRSEVFIQVQISGESKTLTVTQNDVVISPSSGVYDLSFAVANFIVDVRAPGSPGAPVTNSWVSVQELTVQGSWANFTRWVDSSRTDANGRALLSLSKPGYFKLVVNNSTTEPYPELTALIKVTRSGSTSTFYKCTDFESSLSADRNGDQEVGIDDALVCETTPLRISGSSPLLMQFVAAEFQGQISGSSFSWVEIQRLNNSQCENCYEWFGGAQTNQSGSFGVNFGAAGTYKLYLNPPWNDTSGATRTEITVVVAGTSPNRTFTVTRAGNLISPTDGVYIFTLSSANFKGVVKVGSTPEPYSNVSFEKWNTDLQQFEWSSLWANGNARGEFSTSLSDGTWKLTARPGFQNEGSVTPAVAYVKISGGLVTLAGVAKSQACAEDAGHSPCEKLNKADDRYEVLLGTPNFAGFVAKTASSARSLDGSLSNTADAVSSSWIEVQEWNQFEQQYRWSPQLSGVNTSSRGRFATTLPAGNATTNPDSKYQVIVNARPQDTSSGLSRGVFKFKVVDGDVVCDAVYSFCGLGASPSSSSRFDLHLSSANLTGTVTAGANPVSGGQLRAERWNGQWFEWVNLWAQTSGTGRFAMNLDADGIYKITAEAPFWNNTYSGYASASIYVKVAGGQLCLVDDQLDSSCNATASSSLEVGVALTGANVRGKVMSGSDTVRNSWVNVMRYNSSLGWWEWVAGAPVNGSGEFSLSLVPTQDGDTTSPGIQQRFKIEVMPPWGNSTLTRKEVQLWVGSVRQSSGSNYYVECSTSTFDACVGSAKSGNAADVLTVALTSGNLSGKVTIDGTTGMANAWLNVEQWLKPSWAQNFMWMSVDANANTNQSGNYNLNLEGLGDGYFRLTANPGWNNPENLTRTSVVLKQTSGVVCTVNDAADDSCNDTGANPYTRNIQLAVSNVKGTLKDGANAVGFTWVSLMREQNGPAESGAERSGTWYEWLGGANTSATGSFGLRIDSSGRYQIEINPPFNSTLSRFSVYLYAESVNDIYVCSSRSQSNTACVTANVRWTGTRDVLFPASNVAIRVCDKDDTGSTCTGVQNAWVNVFSGDQWVAGSNTSASGIARFSLPDASNYRFEANPNWISPDGVRVETNSSITVAAGLLVGDSVQNTAPVISKSTGQIDIRLGSPNVVGTLYYQVAGTKTAMPYGYIGVRRGDNWLPGAPVDATGGFKLSLENGTYTLTAYSNGNVDRSPVSITVTVTGGVAICPDGNCDIDFDDVIPNVVFNMSNMGTYTRSLYVYNGTTLVTTIAKAPESGLVSVKLRLDNGTYTLRMQRLSTVATNGSTPIVDFNGSGLPTTCQSFELVVSGGSVSDPEALTAWGSSFNGNDATTGLECKAS